MHALRCAGRHASTIPKPSSGIRRVPPSINLITANQSAQTACRRPYSSKTNDASSERGTPIRELGTVGKIEEYYQLQRVKGMTPNEAARDEAINEINREKVNPEGGIPSLRFTDIKTGTKYHAGRSLVTGEEAKELYNEFKAHTAIVKPGPTDLPGKPTQVHILYREPTSPPERILESIRRLCFNPSYIVTKEFGPHAIKSTDLINVELGYCSHYLPHEMKPMVLVHKNWTISKGGRSLEKIFRFDNRTSARDFANGLQRLIKIKVTKTMLVEHHPAFGIYGRRVFVRWGTEQPHEAISSWDIACAKQTDRWAGACNVKDLLPEILDWTFDTKFVDKSNPEQTHQTQTQQSDPETNASDNLMDIIEGLMATTKSLMQAAEEPSTVQSTLSMASEALSKTIEKISKEKEENKESAAAKEAEVLRWLNSEEGTPKQESPKETVGVPQEVIGDLAPAAEVEGSEIVNAEATKAETVDVVVDVQTEYLPSETTEPQTAEATTVKLETEAVPAEVTEAVQAEATKTEAEDAPTDGQPPNNEKTSQ
ncbi:hypothetical protein AOL_s00043g64 [Orbilia oligospora ATCC 24927]|uniref:4a-hydroxytetrahydrobiopterin dehydratase n=1 Tax=Arthrobotrys oligospora (strain ATCC 24927 / CBS 115.81 / DSM 1491) TaxID=756982 RepID=G1X2Z1_ARTOA|nr:hypothetical protein AOL_s00043g64 [Orbilia oligospora ATCC 24927]EGX52275.1 hypothetical protein AOL_s00043g64 [Orbilia oligospora ATCC 24927]